MMAYYNERDPYAAQWLRNLIDAGHIAPGVVDERSITEIAPDDLRGFTQCHFFAGIGVWSYALRRAGWPDDAPIWTGSCPCQPFSAAGQQRGFADERHLWPVWFRLIAERRPPVILGEQVASALQWLDLVSADMESAGYAFGASDLCAAGFGGAHIRQRLYFVAHADDARSQGRVGVPECADQRAARAGSVAGGVDNTSSARCFGAVGGPEGDPRDEARLRVLGEGRGDGGVADAEDVGRGQGFTNGGRLRGRDFAKGQAGRPTINDGVGDHTHAPLLGRDAADWLFCRDGKWRPVEPGTFPLADAAPARVGRLRAYGNALDAETATQFIAAVADILHAERRAA